MRRPAGFGLELQAGARLRCARAAIVGVAMAALPFCAWAGSASTRFGVTVKVAPAIALRGESAAATPVKGATRTLSVSNALAIRDAAAMGYRLRFEIMDPGVRSVDVLGFERPIHVESGNPTVYLPSQTGMPSTPRTLTYVVTYAEGVEPAGHSIPMRMTVQP